MKPEVTLKPEVTDSVIKKFFSRPLQNESLISYESFREEGFDDYIKISSIPPLQNMTRNDQELLKLHLIPETDFGRATI